MKSLVAIIFLVARLGTFAQASISTSGDVKCGSYLEARRLGHDVAEQSVSYVHGFVSAHNIYGAAKQVQADSLPASTIHAYLEKFCRDTPLAAITNAAARLVIDLGGGFVPQNRR